jgi:16S rRNA (guanine966-N2)-methyltransferase
MRIISGEFRSRKLEAPRGMTTRPTSDRLRETLFNVLGPRVDGAQVLDLYAGSGAVGIEALSRGAAGCTFVEEAPAALRAIRANLTALRITTGVQLEAKKVANALEGLTKLGRKLGVDKTGADLIFLDPPYEAADEYNAALSTLGRNAAFLLREGALVIAEHTRKTPPDARYGALERYRILEHGEAALSFYQLRNEPA